MSADAPGARLLRYFAVAGVGLLWNAGLMRLLTGTVGLHYLPAQVLTTALLLFWHYGANALWTFGRGPRSARH